MIASISRNDVKKEHYGLKMVFTLLVFLAMLALTSYYLIRNYYSRSFVTFGMGNKKVYILISSTNRKLYRHNGMDYDTYRHRLVKFEKMAADAGYATDTTDADNLKNLPPKSILLALDVMSLSSKEIDEIDDFVRGGGRLLFNFTAGFLDASLHTRSKNLVQVVTGLRIDPNINTFKQNPKNTGYLSLRLLSPLSTHLPEGKALDLTIYDLLPIYDNNGSIFTDAYMTNWSQDDYVHYDHDHVLKKRQSGLIWHGYKGAGKWIYFSFPSYVFLDTRHDEYARLFAAMLEFLDQTVSVVPYPLVDRPNAVFVSEDTEYKFEYLEAFSKTARKHHFPVTAFCVASLAQKHRSLMERVSRNPYLEIASHSFSHKKIVGESDEVYKRETLGSKEVLESLTGKKVVGFRPPREEIDDKLIRYLERAGFRYIFSAGENRLYPYYHGKIIIIPRHGTDDYSYLVNLDWNASKILSRMKHEAEVVTALDGIYTLSTHTHLMSYGSNIRITEAFFDFVHHHPYMFPTNGESIADRVAARLNLTYRLDETLKNSTLTLFNRGDKAIEKLHLLLYTDPKTRFTGVESEIVGVKTDLHRIDDQHYRLIVDKIDPHSHLTLFIHYETRP